MFPATESLPATEASRISYASSMVNPAPRSEVLERSQAALAELTRLLGRQAAREELSRRRTRGLGLLETALLLGIAAVILGVVLAAHAP